MVKVISISEEAYRRLKRLKREDMSFSDVIISYVETGKEGKTEGWDDLLKWIDKLPKSRKRERTSEHIDSIAYGVSR
jgi:predicted CopG family antitoxin